ncbi:MAG: carboxypeptidase-like regulatory domain-containing protein [Planctomycetota bacterium]
MATRCGEEAPAPEPTSTPTGTADPETAPIAAEPLQAPPERKPAPQRDGEVEPDPIGVRTGTGTLVVHAVHERTDAPAAGMNLRLEGPGAPKPAPPRSGWSRRGSGADLPPISGGRARADRNGTARFDAVPAGDWVLRNDRIDPERVVTVVAGATLHLSYRVQPGVRVQGRVTDTQGTPIAGACIELLTGGTFGSLEHATDTDGAGLFVLHDVHVDCHVVARAEGRRAAAVAIGRVRDLRNVELRLQPGGTVVCGNVETPDGEPVTDAWIQIGAGEPGDARLNLRSDERGQFRAFGLASGEHAWTASSGELAARGTWVTGTFLRIVLQPLASETDPSAVLQPLRPDARPGR